MPLDPGQERNPLGRALAAVEVEERIEDAGPREAEMTVAGGKLPLGPVDGFALVDDEKQGGHEAGPVRTRLAVQHGRMLGPVEEFLGLEGAVTGSEAERQRSYRPVLLTRPQSRIGAAQCGTTAAGLPGVEAAVCR
jgi:hypothetical protein